jgi:hypothetical protein
VSRPLPATPLAPCVCAFDMSATERSKTVLSLRTSAGADVTTAETRLPRAADDSTAPTGRACPTVGCLSIAVRQTAAACRRGPFARNSALPTLLAKLARYATRDDLASTSGASARYSAASYRLAAALPYL